MLINPAPGELALPAELCGCNNEGCFNSLCSGKMILHHVRAWIHQGESTVMTELAGGAENITAEHIGKAYLMGDGMATRAIEQMAKYTAIWLYNIYLMLNINCYVFSGGLLSMGDFYLEKIREQFNRYNQSNDIVHFYMTELEADAGIIGAMELLFDH